MQAGRLVNEYLVDMFSRVEEARLNYIRNNQPNAALDEAVQAEGGTKPGNIYLPSSFLGGRRWCSEQLADALAIVAKYGKPSFFITMTTNPNWNEIKSKLCPGQNYADIPMVVVRAFRQRLFKLKKYIREHFGHVVYSVSVVEFQKRGLPHAHLAVKVNPEPKIPDDIDCVVVAELPQNNEKLKALVLKHMIHTQDVRRRTAHVSTSTHKKSTRQQQLTTEDTFTTSVLQWMIQMWYLTIHICYFWRSPISTLK